LGLLSGKYRFVHQTENDMARSAPLLGILPTLPTDLASATLSAEAAHAVHQIRVLLQTTRPMRQARGVYMVTSACSGEGKTSLTVALGLSFAASGCKTLVVDCDLVGQGLTHGYNAIGEPGLCEALEHVTARGLVKKTPQGLRLLTAGKIDRFGGWTLSASAASSIIAEIRRYYDVVLIDTGPVLGSVEASLIAPEVDGVILTISRGQQRTLVDRAMGHLASLGVKPAGFVFNRARMADFRRAAFSSSAREFGGSSNALHSPSNELPIAAKEVEAFGPLVRSVASFLSRPAVINRG